MEINMSNDDLKARISELETQLAFQDDLLQSLNQVIIRQEEQLQEFDQQLKSLREQVTAISAESAKASGEEPPPPHY